MDLHLLNYVQKMSERFGWSCVDFVFSRLRTYHVRPKANTQLCVVTTYVALLDLHGAPYISGIKRIFYVRPTCKKLAKSFMSWMQFHFSGILDTPTKN
jgi:hypothetical protein